MIHVLSTGQCEFEFIRQPPSTTLEDCSPYNHYGLIRIVMDCVVTNQTDEFEIRWFRENLTGAVEELGLGDPVISYCKGLFSRYHHAKFINRPYNPSYLGKYWCQVINTTADPDQPLMRSNVFTLLAPENYTQPTCVNQIETQIVKNITCADLPVHSEQTTLPAPTTTLSSCSRTPECTTVGKIYDLLHTLLLSNLSCLLHIVSCSEWTAHCILHSCCDECCHCYCRYHSSISCRSIYKVKKEKQR